VVVTSLSVWVLVFWINGQQKAAIDHITGFNTEADCRAAGERLTSHPSGVSYYGDDKFACVEVKP
jgi:hypothetical protein